jgi:RimJ/RimL family protein N-acetyltransferase
MPRRCTVCDHLQRHSIDEALVSGGPYRSVAKRFGLSDSAVYRHKTKHLPAHLLKAKEVEEVARADELLEQVRHLQSRALDILERAEKTGDLRTALAAISQERGNLELLYGIAPEHWNRGLATEIARTLVRYDFEELGFSEVWASTDAPNAVSARVLEKAGLRFERRAVVDGLETHFYSLPRSAFQPDGYR